MTDPFRADDLTAARTWLNRADRALNRGEDSSPEAVAYAHAAAVIGNGFVGLGHATRALQAMDESAKVTARQLVAFDAIAEAAADAEAPTLHAAAERHERAVAEARPHDNEPVRPLNKDCSRGAFLRLECDLQLDGLSVLSLHKVGSDVHLRIWHAGSEEYAVAVLDRKYRRDVAHALTEFDTSEADRA